MLVCGNGIDEDIHQEVNPGYLIKLEEIRMQKGIIFRNVEEFKAYFLE